jgi:glycosyltransferase involved in cell wall biosynthesis
MSRSSLRISVVIPTYQRPHILRRCLAALEKQTVQPELFEVIVADDGADEMTRSLVEAFGDRVPFIVRYLPVTATQGPAAARNAGWRQAQSPLIAFTDDDTLPDPCWLTNGMRAFDDLQVMAAWGRVIVPLPARPTDYEANAAGLQDAVFVTANCFCRKSTLEQVGGFDERFTVAWREDTDLYFSILEYLAAHDPAGKVIACPEAEVCHPVRPEAWGISIRQQRKTRFDALLFKKHPQFYQQMIRSKTSVPYYLLLISLFLALAGALIDAKALTWGGLAMWAGITLWFIWLRLRHTSKKPSHILEMVVTSLVIPYLSLYWRVKGAFEYKVFFF